MVDEVTFYVIAVIMLIFSVMTVTSRKILRAAVSMLFVLVCTAVLFFMLKYDFLAAVQLTVYAGGVVVLIIFSIVLTHQSGEKLKRQPIFQIVSAATIAVVGFGLAIYSLIDHVYPKTTEAALDPSVQNIGRQLLDYDQYGYAFPFEVISVLLLAALVGSIIIAVKPTKKELANEQYSDNQKPIANK